MKITAVLKSMDFKQLWSLFWLSIKHLRFVIPTVKATRRTIAVSTELYGDKHHKNGPENAFRHALWNALIVKYSMSCGRSLARSVCWSKTITDWHEDFSPNEELARAMDLHNNRIGRELIQRFPEESEEFLTEKLLEVVPLSRKRTSIISLQDDRDVLMHIEDTI